MLSVARILSRTQPIKKQLVKTSVASFGGHAPASGDHGVGPHGINVTLDPTDIRMQPLELNVEELSAKPNKTNYEKFVLKAVKKDPSLLNLPKGPFMVRMRILADNKRTWALGFRWLAYMTIAGAFIISTTPSPLYGDADEHLLAKLESAPIVAEARSMDLFAKKLQALFSQGSDITVEAVEEFLRNDTAFFTDEDREILLNDLKTLSEALKSPIHIDPVVPTAEIEDLLAQYAAKKAAEAAAATAAAAAAAAKVVDATVIAQDQQ